MNKLYFGDNLQIMRDMEDERVDLICTDPPFNSGRDYNAFLTASLAQKKAFTDTWTWDTASEQARADFSNWAVTRLGLQPTKDVGDGGMDGRSEAGHITLWNPEIAESKEVLILAEVKSGKPTLTQVRAFCHTMNEHDAIGVFITIEPISQGMRQVAANLGTFYHNNQTFPRLQFWQIDDDYFENPARLSEIIRLPREWLKPTRRAERHSEDRQINMDL